ncbi:MAG: hypothetical protein E7Z77_02490 [Methanobrevibacter sp.]|uniref:hypothetical protein n=1 Tax=Methanobrevibacter sp. TaxID=66852 RepID=UPI0025E29A12|nr:hypothetical protein [Methanobrevibacter sp.]MBE6508263.1 hypothetical protein [Methanobrevibacter sp.]
MSVKITYEIYHDDDLGIDWILYTASTHTKRKKAIISIDEDTVFEIKTDSKGMLKFETSDVDDHVISVTINGETYSELIEIEDD